MTDTVASISSELKKHGTDRYRKLLLAHGTPEPLFGAPVSEIDKLQKRIRKNQALAVELYDSGVYELMYLAARIADPAEITQSELQSWVERAACTSLSEFALPQVAAKTSRAWGLARKWVASKKENVAASGWATLSQCLAEPGWNGDTSEVSELLSDVRKNIHGQPNRVRYTMNGFVIAVGKNVGALRADALKVAEAIGKVKVDMGETQCKVPSAKEYILKAKKPAAKSKNATAAR